MELGGLVQNAIRRTEVAAAGVSALLTVAEPAFADGPLGSNGSVIQTSDYAVDMSHGVVLDGTRPTGLGGAYVAIAEGVDGLRQNPAAPAVRRPYSFSDFDWDAGIGLLLPGMIQDSDFFNSGGSSSELRSQSGGYAFVSPAGLAQWGRWGIGTAIDAQIYRLRRSLGDTAGEEKDELYARFVTLRIPVARAFGDFVVGVGAVQTMLTVERSLLTQDEDKRLFELTGTGAEAGALWQPTHLPFRVGLSARTRVQRDAEVTNDEVVQDSGDRIIPEDPNNPTDPDAPNTIYLPDQVSLPWGVNAGAAFQFGPRPLNPGWENPADMLSDLRERQQARAEQRKQRRAAILREVEGNGGNVAAAAAAIDAEHATAAAVDREELLRERERVDRVLRERYAQMARFYVLVSVSARITGPVDNAVGVESFLQRRVNRSGEKASVSPRLGVESEVVPHWLRLRAGTYLEPSRFQNERVAPRLHATFGFDARVFPWTVFGALSEGTSWYLSAALDAAPRYVSWGASVGIWH
jgi:hypothetical protein